MNLYNLGKVPWEESQLIYHALAAMGREALCLVSPSTPYVCIGFHQDVEQEVDVEFCRAGGIPIFRREVGGGAVYLDGDQLFYQLILHRDNPLVPKRKEAFYQRFLEPVVNVYRRIGIEARYKPVNDVIAGTRKISGTGVGEIGDSVVFVGNLILDFNYEMMAKVLKVPDEKFRDKVHKTLQENLTTIRKELGETLAGRWNEETLNALTAEEFQKILGPIEPAEKDEELQHKISEIGSWMLLDEWLHQKGRRVPGRDVKIRAGLNVLRRVHKAPGGLIRADFELRDGRIGDIHISGDFFCFPGDGIGRLESLLEGAALEDLKTLLSEIYTKGHLETPGIGIDDWLQVIGAYP